MVYHRRVQGFTAAAVCVLLGAGLAAAQPRGSLMKSGQGGDVLVKAVGKLALKEDERFPFAATITAKITSAGSASNCSARAAFNPYLDPAARWSINGVRTGACGDVFDDAMKAWAALPRGEYAASGIDPNASLYDCDRRNADTGKARFVCAMRLPTSYPESLALQVSGASHTIVVDTASGEIRTIISRLDDLTRLGGGHRIEGQTITTDLDHIRSGALRVIKSQTTETGARGGADYRTEMTIAYSYPSMSLD